MNLFEAQKLIKDVNDRNSHILDLRGKDGEYKLTSEDFEQLIPQIKSLTSLTHLLLSNNRLVNLDAISSLTGLTHLYLTNNHIKNLRGIEKLSRLKELYLKMNQITDVSPLSSLTDLTHLYLSNNYLTKLAGFDKLTNLRHLYLSNNHLTNIESLKSLSGLTHLYLSNNELDDASVLKNLKELNQLSISQNNFTDLDFLFELRNLDSKSVFLSENPVIIPPKEIVQQGLKAIWTYFEDINQHGIDYIYETKVLIVGETHTGKTTLFRKLLDPNYLPQKGNELETKSTIGININSWHFPYLFDKKKKIKANLWDFGGQEIQYTLHQYFLTKSSFYIFLVSNRVSGNENIHKADYWFKVISALGKNCPILVVINEINDESANSFELNKYVEQFGDNLGEIEKISVNFAKNDYKWENLINALKEKISNLKHIGKETDEDKVKGIKKGLPSKWIKVRVQLEELAEKHNYIELSKYYQICKDVGIYEGQTNNDENRELSQNVLLRFLHNLGIIINFEDAFLRNYLILKPLWITDALYVVLENKTIQEEQNGKFTSIFIENLWKNKSYNCEDYNILLQLMLIHNFEIAYKVNGKEDDYVIPMLLPDTRLTYKFNEENLITLIIRFGFLPRGVFSRLIVQLNNYIDTQKVNSENKQIVWKKGMLIKRKEVRGNLSKYNLNDSTPFYPETQEDEDAYNESFQISETEFIKRIKDDEKNPVFSFAEIIESDDREQTPKEISIRVSGKSVTNNKIFLGQILSHLYQINDDWFNCNLKFDELIPCICDVCKNKLVKELYSLKRLENFLRASIDEVDCGKSVDEGIPQKVPIRKMLEGVYIKSKDRYGNTYIFEKETQFIQEAKDNVSVSQRNMETFEEQVII